MKIDLDYNINNMETRVDNKCKAFTSLEQSRKLEEILPLESADMCYLKREFNDIYIETPILKPEGGVRKSLPCWSLTSLLDILHSKAKDIPSLSGGGYKDGKYISDWCLDYEFENGDYQKTFADNPIDACVAMIEKLHELNLL